MKNLETTNKGAIDITELMEYLSVGRQSADKVGKEAGAIIRIGRRKLFNVKKIQAYLDSKCEEEE